jgi:hypothetical protein
MDSITSARLRLPRRLKLGAVYLVFLVAVTDVRERPALFGCAVDQATNYEHIYQLACCD